MLCGRTSECVGPEVKRSRSRGYHMRRWRGYARRHDCLALNLGSHIDLHTLAGSALDNHVILTFGSFVVYCAFIYGCERCSVYVPYDILII